MNDMTAIRFKYQWVLAIVLLMTFACSFVVAQTEPPRTIDTVGRPDSEDFIPADEVIIPWIDSFSTCYPNSYSREPGCPEIPDYDVHRASNMVTLYDDKGDIWFRFSVEWQSPEYLRKKPKPGFEPLAPRNGVGEIFDSVAFRLVGESEHWFQVEVNTTSRDTKYILRSDPNTVKISWGRVFNWGQNVTVADNVKLRDKPDGDPIEESKGIITRSRGYNKISGDWLFVTDYSEQPQKIRQGWIRWRRGRDILVGYKLNDYKVPKLAKDEK